MMESGYYRFPSIHENTVVFVCEDDLWVVPTAGGVARRLTANPGQASNPALSPDGATLAFTGRDEGKPEVYTMPAAGGPAQRLTYLGADSWVVGWSPDGQEIIFASNTAQPFARQYLLYAIDRSGSTSRVLPTGPAMSISYGPTGGMVIGRNTTDLAHWKRYRGGLTGALWIDADGSGEWRRLSQFAGNVALPLWVGERIYFLSDHQGIGNLYSCLPTGADLRRHTHHADYYVRHPSTDGRRIVYHAGADLYLFDPATDATQRIEVVVQSPQPQRKRKFVDAARYLQGYHVHPQGHSVALITRGKPFTMGNWEGAVVQHGDLNPNLGISTNSTRYRQVSWLGDGKRLVMVSDAGGEPVLEVHHADASAALERLEGLDIGQPMDLVPAPKGSLVALSNHRNDLVLVDLDALTVRVLDHSRYAHIQGMAWSPDGRWIAYGFHTSQQMSIIKLCQIATGETISVTRPVLRDVAPAFDPGGKYLYFLSYRVFDPVYDNMHFDLNFPWGVCPYLITLRADLPSPFIPTPRPPGGQKKDEKERHYSAEQEQAAQLVTIDLDGIADRVIAFPVPAARYGQIQGVMGKVLFSSYPLEGSLGRSWFFDGEPPAKGKIEIYDFDEQRCEVLIEGITSFAVSQDAKTLIYRAGNRLRVHKADEKPKDDAAPNRGSGWLDLDRVKVSVEPSAEWEQMYREAWRLQRDHFWTEDMSGIDWQLVYQRYLPLLARVATRSEFSDLLTEMQGELGTSHAYELGGDYRPEPRYEQGLLGADFVYDSPTDSFRLAHIVQGDVWDPAASSPLCQPGINVQPGDRLIAVGGRAVSRARPPQALLVNQANNEVLLTFAGADDGVLRTFAVKALQNETPARYREWVESNRQQVHAATDGRVGYIHIPDMGPRGYAEFHRGYLAEVEREGLIVDVRFNGGGHVSQLVLEKLARRQLGYDVNRWGQPIPYPVESLIGPMVALTNEQAGSDGDIFSHVFKLLGLGPLIGKRTWGGVIGISVRERLVDGGITTQPEYAFWFKDVGWNVENYGTDPDIEVDIRPQDHVAGHDAQLRRGIEEVLRLLSTSRPALPAFDQRPRLGLPKLPDV